MPTSPRWICRLPMPPRRKRRAKEQLAKLIAALPEKWPVADKRWTALHPVRVETASEEEPKILDDHSALFTAPGPEKDDYTFVFDTGTKSIGQLRLEALTDKSLPQEGPAGWVMAISS